MIRNTDHLRPGYPFEKIRAWQEARKFTVEIYRVTADFPKAELFGLTSQIRRAMTSVTANIAEGSRRETVPDYAHFVGMSDGSMAEVKNFLILAVDLGYLTMVIGKALIERADQICAMLYSLRQEIYKEHARSAAAS
jgi:four helix bundle protein